MPQAIALSLLPKQSRETRTRRRTPRWAVGERSRRWELIRGCWGGAQYSCGRTEAHRWLL